MKILFSLLGISILYAGSPDYFSVGLGAYDFHREKRRAVEIDLEYNFHPKWFGSPFRFLEFRPLVGIMATAKGSGYVYVGLNLDLLFAEHLLISPGLAGGYYWQGGGKDLGYPIEFRSGVELAWQFSDWRRIGIHFYHLSNASLGRRNPGEESLILFYDIPISKCFPFGCK
jgi:lipid A 3-O-deacylase